MSPTLMAELLPEGSSPQTISMASMYMKQRLTNISKAKSSLHSLWIFGVATKPEFIRGKFIIEKLSHSNPQNFASSIVEMNEFEYEEFLLSMKKYHHNVLRARFPYVLAARTNFPLKETFKIMRSNFTTDSAAANVSELFKYKSIYGMRDDSLVPQISHRKLADFDNLKVECELMSIIDLEEIYKNSGNDVSEIPDDIHLLLDNEMKYFLKKTQVLL
ncbi:hypothetical protein HK096_010800 [Nowakowskiella sp. JEL0078]|nr:hypothetical protein HK096_010800 [Nowakowskiella sp. JEL0078]